MSSSPTSSLLSLPSSPTRTKSTREINLESLSDLSFALTALYRTGKLSAHSETESCSKDKGENLFEKGSRVAYRMSQHKVFKHIRNGECSTEAQRNGKLSLTVDEVLRRGSYIALCYALALAAYPSALGDPSQVADHSESVNYWLKAIAVEHLPGGISSSRPAEDLVEKAKHRVEMIRVAKEREEEINELHNSRKHYRLHLPLSENAKHSLRAAHEPLLSPSHILDDPLSSLKASPVVTVLRAAKPSILSIRTHSHDGTERRRISRQPMIRKASCPPSVPSSPEQATQIPVASSRPLKFTLMVEEDPEANSDHLTELSPPAILHASAPTQTHSPSRSYRSKAGSISSFRSPNLARRLRSGSVTTQLSVDRIGIPPSPLMSRGSSVSLASEWSAKEHSIPSRASSYVLSLIHISEPTRPY